MILYTAIAISFILALLLEGSVLSFFIVERALPDLLLVLVMMWGFILGRRSGALLGLLGGFFQDILFGSGLGYFALAKMLMGYGAGTLGREFYREQLLAPVLLLFVGTLSHELMLNILVSQFIGLGLPVKWTINHFLIPKAVYNSGLTLLLYPFMMYLYNTLGKKNIRLRGQGRGLWGE